MDTRDHFLGNTAGYSSPPTYTPQGFYYLNLHTTTTTQFHEASTLTPHIFASTGIAPDFNSYATSRCFPDYFGSFTDNNCHLLSNVHNNNNNDDHRLMNSENCNNNYYNSAGSGSGYEIHEENLNKNQKVHEKEKASSDCECSFSYAGSDEYAPYEGQGLQSRTSAIQDLSNYGSDDVRKEYVMLNSVVKGKELQKGSKSEELISKNQLTTHGECFFEKKLSLIELG